MFTPYNDNPEYAAALVKYQNFTALKNALDTVDKFAMNLCAPDQYEEFYNLSKMLSEAHFAEDPTPQPSGGVV